MKNVDMKSTSWILKDINTTMNFMARETFIFHQKVVFILAELRCREKEALLILPRYNLSLSLVNYLRLISQWELNKIYLGDCIKIMRDIPSSSIDLVFADPHSILV
jgi:hypothetical protein